MFGFQSFSESPYSTVGGVVAKLGSASITGVGTVVADALRVRTSAGSISATTTVTADGLKILFGSGFVHGALANQPHKQATSICICKWAVGDVPCIFRIS